jgi:hypothetical protein
VTLSHSILGQLADIFHHLICSALEEAFSSSKSIRGTKALRDFEIPAAVILDADSWTQRNGMLTVTGKPRRDRVRTKFLREMQTVYSALSIAHTGAGEGEGEPQNIPTAPAHLLSPSPDIGLAPTPSSSMRVAVTDLDLVAPVTVLQSPPQPSMVVADSAVLVASLSAHWGSRCHARLAVAVRLPAVLELSCSLQAPFAALVASLSRTVGPSSVAEVKNHDLPPFLVLRLHCVPPRGQRQSSI